MHSVLSHEWNVCLSVRLSVKRVDCDKIKETSEKIFYTVWRRIYLVLWHRIPGIWKILGQTDSILGKNGDFQSIFARRATAVTHSKKFNEH